MFGINFGNFKAIIISNVFCPIFFFFSLWYSNYVYVMFQNFPGFLVVIVPHPNIFSLHFYLFPRVAAVTNYHKLGSLKQQNYICSQFGDPKIQNWGVSRAVFSLKVLGKNFPLPLLAFGGCWQSLLFFSFLMHYSNLCSHINISLSPVSQIPCLIIIIIIFNKEKI